MEINFLINPTADNTIWVEIGLVAFGAVLGFLLSILTTMVTKAMDKRGKLQFYYRLIRPNEPLSFSKNGFIIVWFEFLNTSNTTHVIRDVCLYLYKNNKKVERSLQIQRAETEKERGGEIVKETIHQYGGEKNSYSFVLPPINIQKQECSYICLAVSQEKEQASFDEIRVGYYDEKNSFWEAPLCEFPDGCRCKELEYSQEQKLLIFKKSDK